MWMTTTTTTTTTRTRRQPCRLRRGEKEACRWYCAASTAEEDVSEYSAHQ